METKKPTTLESGYEAAPDSASGSPTPMESLKSFTSAAVLSTLLAGCATTDPSIWNREDPPATSEHRNANEDSFKAKIVSKIKPAIQSAYEKRLKRNPSLSGRLDLSFVVDKDGYVKEVQLFEDSQLAKDQELQKAIWEALVDLRFDPTGEETKIENCTIFLVAVDK